MQSHALKFQPSLPEVLCQIWATGKISYTDRQTIQSVLLADSLSEEEQSEINRVLYAVRRGWLQF